MSRPTLSAGILMYRRSPSALEVLLVHPGGPFWRRRDEGAWQIPKGEASPHETLEQAARREFEEELGVAPEGVLASLGRIKQKGGKSVEAFALEGQLDVTAIRSNEFSMEWPPHSGRIANFPEVDRAEWFAIDAARGKMLASQLSLLDRLVDVIG
ncbi:MAG TPA: NUDIX domain-containing protein [Stellaceae bacterium]|nr:NUDIX domain-containing protein [Stellaceae bacterium]